MELQTHIRQRKLMWRKANVKLLPTALLFITGITISSFHGGIHRGNFGHKLISLIGVILFVVAAITFMRILTTTIAKVLAIRHLTKGRAASFQFILRLVGYISIILTTLDLVGVPIGQLVLGGAALGIILGVAAQQALANFFASIVIIVSHPFYVGDDIELNSGALGGKFIGTVKDIGLTHTKLKRIEDGNIVLLPNATVLSGASIIRQPVPLS